MRLKARQHRFVAAVIGGWGTFRLAALWPRLDAPAAIGGAGAIGAVAAGLAIGGLLLPPPRTDMPPFVPAPLPRAIGMARRASLPWWVSPAPLPASSSEAADPGDDSAEATAGRWLLMALEGGEAAMAPERMLRHAVFARSSDLAPPYPSPARTATSSRWSADLYLFLRPGSGRAALALGGELGGSQIAGRVAYALNRTGPVRTAVAARVYAPVASRGAEAAVGLDWHPFPRWPFRLSAERRQRLDGLGRSAWSLYGAGGFFADRLPLGLQADGYAQAGVVGARRRDGFVDGALRVGRVFDLGWLRPSLGAGAWGAAQPGVSRLDLGPRASVTLPVAAHAITVALDGRLRVAGHARPGSGVALTIAAGL